LLAHREHRIQFESRLGIDRQVCFLLGLESLGPDVEIVVFEVVLYSEWRAVFTNVIAAPGITAPLGSFSVPEILPLAAAAAIARAEENRIAIK
jgi:hypothetical protein